MALLLLLLLWGGWLYHKCGARCCCCDAPGRGDQEQELFVGIHHGWYLWSRYDTDNRPIKVWWRLSGRKKEFRGTDLRKCQSRWMEAIGGNRTLTQIHHENLNLSQNSRHRRQWWWIIWVNDAGMKTGRRLLGIYIRIYCILSKVYDRDFYSLGLCCGRVGDSDSTRWSRTPFASINREMWWCSGDTYTVMITFGVSTSAHIQRKSAKQCECDDCDWCLNSGCLSDVSK